jgi:hypothetical protein
MTVAFRRVLLMCRLRRTSVSAVGMEIVEINKTQECYGLLFMSTFDLE